MLTLLLIARSLGVIILALVVVSLLNLPHDFLLNHLYPGSARQHVPLTPTAEVLSASLLFIAGTAAGLVVYLTGGRQRRVLLGVLLLIFVALDLSAVLRELTATSLLYRVALVGTIPLQLLAGYWLGRRLFPKLAAVG